jgi:hypothetical protein
MSKQNVYSTNTMWEEEVITLAEQYQLWYSLATPEIQAEWKKVFDPAFIQLDLLMDSYSNMVKNGLTTTTIIVEINKIKTQIMIELVRRQTANEG